MEYLIGIALALFVAGGGALVGFDRERVFYPLATIVIASYYILFAAMGAPARVVFLESVAAVAFWLIAVIGFKRSLWLVVIALASHGVFDSIHHLLIDDPAVPPWWPGFCLAFDIAAAGCLAVLLVKRPGLARQAG